MRTGFKNHFTQNLHNYKIFFFDENYFENQKVKLKKKYFSLAPTLYRLTKNFKKKNFKKF